MNFTEFYMTEATPLMVDPNAWKERRVMHVSPTGQKNKIKIKYLPKEDQVRYMPTFIRNLEAQKKRDAEAEGRDVDNMEVRLGQGKNKKISTNPLDLAKSTKKKYNKAIDSQEVTSDDQEDDKRYIDKSLLLDLYYAVEDPDKFNIIEKDRLIEATTEAENTQEWESKGLYICEAINVPMEAIIAYKNKKDKWITFKNKLDDEKKINFIKFNDIHDFKLNLENFLDIVRFNLLTDVEGEK